MASAPRDAASRTSWLNEFRVSWWKKLLKEFVNAEILFQNGISDTDGLMAVCKTWKFFVNEVRKRTFGTFSIDPVEEQPEGQSYRLNDGYH
jgi:hypothetical protein